MTRLRTHLYPVGVIFASTAHGSCTTGVFTTATWFAREQFSPLAPQKGGVTKMKIRDWIDLARIELRREEGQTMTEYGVLLALIAVGVIAVLIVLGPKIADAFTSVSNSL